MTLPAVTVVVATRNRPASLLRTLPRHEAPVIVVDNGSAETALDAVRLHHPDVRFVRLAHNIGAVARNVGAQLANTRYVAFADDDSWWHPGALARAVDVLDRHPRLAVLAARTVVGADERPDPLSDALAASPLGCAPDLPGPSVLGFLSCSIVVRRGAFLAVGGFDDLLFFRGEETLLALDLTATGWGVAYVDSVLAHHDPDPRDPAAQSAARQREVRNALLTLWMRRPLPLAVARTAAAAGVDPVHRRAVGEVLVRLPRALARRRRLPAHVEQAFRRLERSEPAQ
jgi:GT2 family glycosyltransferase